MAIKHWRNFKTERKITEADKVRVKELAVGEVSFDEPMSDHTSMRVGGPADIFVKPHDIDALVKLLAWAHAEQIPVFILGNGSNTIVRDGGLRGLVIKTDKCLVESAVLDENDQVIRMRFAAGYPISRLIQLCRDQGYSGVEALAGVPGTVGGAVFMNAGTRQGTISDALLSLRWLLVDGTSEEKTKKQLEFSYRKLKVPKGAVILDAVLELKKSDVEQVSSLIRDYQKRRSDTQPLMYPNSGSIFKNPQDGKKKLPPAAELIEEVGLKGVRVGQARISEKHANFIVNEGGATAKDVLVLMRLVKDKVREETGIVLESEVKVIGVDDDGADPEEI